MSRRVTGRGFEAACLVQRNFSSSEMVTGSWNLTDIPFSKQLQQFVERERLVLFSTWIEVAADGFALVPSRDADGQILARR